MTRTHLDLSSLDFGCHHRLLQVLGYHRRLEGTRLYLAARAVVVRLWPWDFAHIFYDIFIGRISKSGSPRIHHREAADLLLKAMVVI